MNQSNRIFAFLAAAFVIFITMRGELRTYLGFLIGGATPGTGETKTAATETSSVSQSSNLSTAAQVAEIGTLLIL